VPYKFNQRVVGDVDFRIMGTFIEFYMTLLGFVNFRLYTSAGLKYPPKFDQKKDDQPGELGAFTLEGAGPATTAEEPKAIENGSAEHGPDPQVQAEVNKLVKQLKAAEVDGTDGATTRVTDDEIAGQTTDAFDKFEPVAPGGDILPQPAYSTSDPGRLFSNFTFFLSRETPRQPLEFLLKAFGCKRVGWPEVLGDGAYTTDELDPSITHQIVDRPVVQAAVNNGGDGEDNQTSQKLGPNQRVAGRVYVQPQWVWDSINDEELKDPALYAPGAELPPHLSPFVKPTQGQYDPTVSLEEQQTEAEALADSDVDELEDGAEGGSDEDMVEDDFAVKAIADADAEMDVAGSEDSEHDSEEDNEDAGSFGGFSDDEQDAEDDEEADTALQHQRELEAELSGKPVKAKTPQDPKAKAKAEARKALARATREQDEDLERAKGMLSKKKRKLYEQMVYSNNKKSAEDERLRAKRRKLERQKSAAAASTASK